MAAEYPPYVNGYGGIPKLFAKIKEASVPPKFTQDFVNTALGLKSSSFRAMIPLLKRLGFIDQANVPTQAYKDYRDSALSPRVMAERLRDGYKDLFQSNEYAWKLSKKEMQERLKAILGAAESDQAIPTVASTFIELAKLATWDGAAPKKNKQGEEEHVPSAPDAAPWSDGLGGFHGKLGLSYTINLNLPATTEIEVFNAIFKSLRENLLRD
ncbi:MAG: DUF5343 domain-containing protein [Candidatus Acidiferrales bacterium]